MDTSVQSSTTRRSGRIAANKEKIIMVETSVPVIKITKPRKTTEKKPARRSKPATKKMKERSKGHMSSKSSKATINALQKQTKLTQTTPPKQAGIKAAKASSATPKKKAKTSKDATKTQAKATTAAAIKKSTASTATPKKGSKKSNASESTDLCNLGTNPELLERIERSLQERLFLVHRTPILDQHEEFSVLGRTGNLYKVTVAQTPKCSCRDFIFRKKGCKHLFFVLIRVLGLPTQSSLIAKKTFDRNDLKAIFKKRTVMDPTCEANDAVKNMYAVLSGEQPLLPTKPFTGDANAIEKSSFGVVRRPQGGDCPICFEVMDENEPLVWCQKTCGNNIHHECFELWSKSRAHSYSGPQCVYCRSPWVTSNGEGKIVKVQGYYNFSEVV